MRTWKETVRKRALIVTELFNIVAKEFDVKNVARWNRTRYKREPVDKIHFHIHIRSPGSLEICIESSLKMQLIRVQEAEQNSLLNNNYAFSQRTLTVEQFCAA